MEGLSKETLIDPDMAPMEDNQAEDETSFKPTAANTLTSSDIYYEMEKRNLKSTGFPDTDREILQRAFNEEFFLKLDEERAKLKERRRRAAQQAGLQRRRMLMEQTLQEEQDALAADLQVGMMIELIKDNLVEKSIRIDVNSITARSLAKAMWVNSTITCLELSSNNLNDHAGSYLARTLTRNKTLKKIELDNNKLGSKSLLAFGESMKANTSLLYLSLDSNPIFSSTNDDIKGAQALSEALKVNKTLTSLNLWRTGMKATDGELLADALGHNKSILFLDIGHNNVQMREMKKIADKLDVNLGIFEKGERVRREEALTDAEKDKRIQDKKDTEQKDEELKMWLEQRREQRAEAKRQKEEEIIAEMQRLADIKRKQFEEQRAQELKEKQEAAEKKAKKDKAKKNKK